MMTILLEQADITQKFSFLLERENLVYIIVLVLFIGTPLYTLITYIVHKRKGVDSPAKHRIEEIIHEVTGGDARLTAAYAIWRTAESRGNRTIIRFWYYAIGFSRERIVIVPLSFSNKKPRQITYKDSIIIEPEMLGLVNGKKNWVELYDKQGNKIVSLKVKEVTTDSGDTSEKADIVQKEVAQKWCTEFVPYWMEKVNTANGTKATGYHNNASKHDYRGRGANEAGGGKAKNM